MLYIVGVFFLVAPPIVWTVSTVPGARPAYAQPAVRTVAPTSVVEDVALTALTQRAQQDPMFLVEKGRERYQNNVSEYRCVLTKQERLGRKLSDVQEVELRYRESPHTVYMLWRKNADGARRAMYVDNNDYVDGKGRKLVRVEPNGAVARLFTKDIKIRMDSKDAKKASRRSIDDCGFLATFDLLLEYNEIARQRGVLDLRYAGTGEIDGRRTHVIVRDLPYEGEKGPYPDARMVLHIDQEWLLPVAVFSYADHEERQLLGRSVFSSVDLDPEFTDADFKF
jgi:hypothetical protein